MQTNANDKTQPTRMTDRTPTPSTNAKERPVVAAARMSPRARVARACEPCRRLKEKCDGLLPCARCTRFRRPCQFNTAMRGHQHRSRDGSVGLSIDVFDLERIRGLEQIVQHFTGSSQMDKEHVINLAASLRQQPQPQPQPQPAPSAVREPVQPVPSAEPAGNESMDTASEEEEDNVNTGNRYTGELSHTEFSNRLQSRVEKQLHDTISTTGNIPTPLATESSPTVPSQQHQHQQSSSHLKPSVVAEAIAMFPPSEVMYFLLRIFFDIAQTNYSYVDENLVQQKLQMFYSGASLALSVGDTPWVCIILLMLAAATQFAHLNACGDDRDEFLFLNNDSSNNNNNNNNNHNSKNSSQSADDQLAMAFYKAASKLMPDVLAAGSVESVQAFLLFAVVTLPMDATGLSSTYLGIAIRIATLNGMHRNYRANLEDSAQVELRRRLWWTAYTLERRICVMHGRPISISPTEVDCELPRECAELRKFTTANNMPNIQAMIKITEMLEIARNRIVEFRQTPRRQRGATIKAIEQLKKDLEKYWNNLPRQDTCRDLDPTKPLFRFNLHLALTYHLTYIFIGRSFILDKATLPENNNSTWQATRDRLVKDCIQSAITIINLCQTLHNEVSLGRASYTEFTSCCAALLVVLARRISAGTPELQTVCDRGIRLLKKMSVGIYSNSEKLTVEALERAIETLHAHQTQQQRLASQGLAGGHGNGGSDGDHSNGTNPNDIRTARQAYAHFRHWVTTAREVDPLETTSSVSAAAATTAATATPGHIPPAAVLPGVPVNLSSVMTPQTNPVSSVISQSLQDMWGAGAPMGVGYDQLDSGDSVSVQGLDEWFRYGLN